MIIYASVYEQSIDILKLQLNSAANFSVKDEFTTHFFTMTFLNVGNKKTHAIALLRCLSFNYLIIRQSTLLFIF